MIRSNTPAFYSRDDSKICQILYLDKKQQREPAQQFFVNWKFCKDPKLVTAYNFFFSDGLNPPHTHPRATGILVVTQGTLYVGFVTSNPKNHLFAKVLKTGDVFVLPVGKTNVVAFAGVSSQNPGVIGIADAFFGSMPAINPDVLPMAFKLDRKTVEYIQTQL
ncbi:hypothetical protein V6N13_014821 [Hibiscus sabdariffa]